MTRPFFGEQSRTLGAPVWRNTNDGERRGTPAERYRWRVLEGMCPGSAGNCGGTLDDDLFCDRCGQIWPAPDEAETPQRDFIPRLPGALFVDEFAPAQVDEDVA